MTLLCCIDNVLLYAVEGVRYRMFISHGHSAPLHCGNH